MYPWTAGEEITSAKLKANAGDYQTAGGTANAITVTGNAVSGYTAGDCYVFKAASTNTDAVTLQVNALAAKSIKKKNGDPLVANDILSGDICVVVYDGTNFRLVSDTKLIRQSAFDLLTYSETIVSATDPTTFVEVKVALSPDGTDLYVAIKTGTSPNQSIRVVRYSIDALTGEWSYTGTTVTLDESGGDFGNTTDFGIGVSTTYVWVTALNAAGTGTAIYRYTRALASEQLMTISGSPAFTTAAGIAANDSNLWLFQTGGTSVQLFTVSGNTATVSTTFTNPCNGNLAMGPYYDGTDILFIDRSATGNPVRRINTSGTSQGTTTARFWHTNTGTTLSWTAFEPDPIACGPRDLLTVYTFGIEKPSTSGGAIIRAHAVTKP